MIDFQTIDKNLLFTKNDKEDPRLGECVQTPPTINLNNLSQYSFDFAFLGFPDDDGIALNGGRLGAKLAPREIRSYLYKMTPHLSSQRLPVIYDFGDVMAPNITLGERHETARKAIHTLAAAEKKWISVGGGHDYGYCDGAGFLDAHKNNAVIINFDAHLDVRPPVNGFNSGTPFHRILTEFKGQFDFAEVGIQNQCNSQAHYAWAQNQGATIYTLNDIHSKGLLKTLQEFMRGKESKKIFISIDIDAFSSSEAPGCSQSWTTGLFTQEFLVAFNWLVSSFSVQGMGVYEVSPALDQDNRTSKLAALLIHNFIFTSISKA